MISGIICEFNPFHAGHKHLIGQVKCHPGDAVVCVMSGNFVQRGAFAVYDKRARTETALKGGADLVLELPTAYATRSARALPGQGCSCWRPPVWWSDWPLAPNAPICKR